MQVDVHTALSIGEAHFEQCCNQTAGRDVVTSHNPTLLDHFLNCVEAVGEVFGVLYGRNVVANESEALCKGTAAKTLLVEREVNMIE